MGGRLGSWLWDRNQASLRIAFLALCAVGILSLAATIEIFEIDDRTTKYQVELEESIAQRSQVRRVATLVLDAEASQRGYLLTARTGYLERFRVAAQAIPDAGTRLRGLFMGRDAQASRAKRLSELAHQRVQQMTAAIADKTPTSPSEPAVDPVSADDALRIMAEFREIVDTMISFEEQEIRNASQVMSDGTRWSRKMTVILLCSIVLLMTAVVGFGLAYLAHHGRVAGQLREATRIAEQASEAKTEFLASMSHEIRTPLTGVLGYTGLLLEEKLSCQQRNFVERLQIAGVALEAIVNDILDFSRIEAGQVVLDVESFSLRALTENVISIVSVSSDKKDLQLRCEVDPALPAAVAGDEPRLRQILLNLLNNAVKFTHAGSVTLRLTRADGSVGGDAIRFEVIDTGIGIAPERQRHLFQRFSQLDTSIQREYGGTGLGLAISRKLAELMGGEIGVNSEQGRGATFWFTVPLPEATVVDQVSDGENEPAHGARGHILLVEDSPQNQDLVCTILAREGHIVDVASDGEEALAAIRTTDYDLVLMDMQMPRMDGVTATRMIRELDSPARTVRIIAMSANVMPGQMQPFIEAGIDDHLAKPFTKSALTSKVSHWLSVGASTPPGEDDHHEQAFAEIRELMGDEWIRASLERLKERVDTMLGDPARSAVDRLHVKGEAHQIVADAGQLGFGRLSHACSMLEMACADRGDLSPVLEQARAAGRAASFTADRLLARLSA